MKRKNRPTDGGGNWMDTYGDMVTLLLTFFIMLYSMSSVDAQKWDVFVRSITPENSKQTEETDKVTVHSQTNVDGEEATGVTIGTEEGGIRDLTDTNTLYLTIAEKLNEIGVKDATVVRGDDYTYITFKDSTFFNGGSSIITKQGQMVLTALCESIAPAREGIGLINIMAHTAKADVNGVSDVRLDRILSANRAAEVAIYIQKQNVIAPEKLVSISYGEFRPIADNSTAEGRAKNRRVELILLDKGAKEKGMDQYYDELKSGEYSGTTVVTMGRTDKPNN